MKSALAKNERGRARLPRVVVVTRRTALEGLLERFSTRGQVEFYLANQPGAPTLEELDLADELQRHAVQRVTSTLGATLRRAAVDRDDLPAFLFAPEDIVVAVGQDGLVVNVAKYVESQPVIGVNPDPERFDGVLCRFSPDHFADVAELITSAGEERERVESRTLVRATLDDGRQLDGLNEIFIGHATHQSARYRLRVDGAEERQSSSGLIVSTGTGATGWTRSIAEQRGLETSLPSPTARRLSWFVREPFPSIATETSLDFGLLDDGEALVVESDIESGGVIFADGMEFDHLPFLQGQSVRLEASSRALRLRVPDPAHDPRAFSRSEFAKAANGVQEVLAYGAHL